MKVYLAGPLFTNAERDFNVRLRDALIDNGHEVWLPQDNEPRHKTARAIFEMDVTGLCWANVVVANMDGPDPDSGTCWECGYAYGRKPVIVYRTDFRAGDEGDLCPYNLMLTESATIQLLLPFKPFNEVVESIVQALNKIEEDRAP